MARAGVVSIFEVAPGQMSNVNEPLRDYRSFAEGRGATTVNFWVTVYAGPNANRLVVESVYENAAAAGAALDHIMSGDVEQFPLQAIQQNGTAKLVARFMTTEWTP